MKQVDSMVVVLALAGCSAADANDPTDFIYGSRWSVEASRCQSDYATFSAEGIALTKWGRPDGVLPVRRVVRAPDQPSSLMFVISPQDGSNDVAMVFKLSGDRLTLIGEGTPSHLLPVTPAEKNYARFNLSRCA